MKILYSLAMFHAPSFLKKKGLVAIVEASAAALGRKSPPTNQLSFQECLETYARFTEEGVTHAIEARRDIAELEASLRTHAVEIGKYYRKLFGVGTRADAMSAARLLYRMMGIDFHGTTDGDITISRCAFDRFYSPRTCRVMASFDEGVLAGLAGEGSLAFEGRLTDGHPFCEARFTFKEADVAKGDHRR